MGWAKFRVRRRSIARPTINSFGACRRAFVPILAGGILAAGVFAAPTPTKAGCELDFSGSPYFIRCDENVPGAFYEADGAPVDEFSTVFDNDVRLVTLKGPVFFDTETLGTHGIEIDGTPDSIDGHNVEVFLTELTAIRSDAAGIRVTTDSRAPSDPNPGSRGDITIEQRGFVEAVGAGVWTQSIDGVIDITNSGIIGVEFDENLVLDEDDNQFEIEGTPTTLTAGDAFTLSQVGGAGISATVTGDGFTALLAATPSITIENTVDGEIYAAGNGIEALIQPGDPTMSFSKIIIDNWGTIGSADLRGGGNGISATNNGLGELIVDPLTVTAMIIRNLSTSSIVVDEHGIEAIGGGGDG